MASLQAELYYWPSSFYSQKVLLALHEKKVNYKSRIVNLFEHEVNEPWFVRLNPNGQVPLLKLGDKFISQSDSIIDAVDQLNNAPVLVPDSSTPEGQLTKQWRAKLDSFNVEGLTFGVLLNPELAVDEIKVPSAYRMTKEEYRVKSCKSVERLEKLREQYPELKEAYDIKIERYKKRGTSMFEKSDTVAVMEVLETLLDEVEEQLRKSRSENIIEHWLCGPRYTAADISLCVLLGRLVSIGLLSKYLNPAKRPALIEYWNQARQRPSVQKGIMGVKSAVLWYQVRKALKKVVAGAAVAGGVVALGVMIGQKYKA
ncbi:ganglioside-induced differentiation-associated protein 1-like [Biomphalaria glabrata]|uniref:Ganglioside-induced differentiation-associated protein 1-like n=1 Tax=Biomphalaria glabrata TaxID=6526 RepID=A0A9W3AUR9_BIOGL|nr:ganglioside-induced differentiation-associated protein 1-like [Biomphalaria glabrata]XP_055891059.1 ganglioside-induced differentiation-associated protein 1-like [Biomphalaria glabrata]